jgi:hypothetical protein
MQVTVAVFVNGTRSDNMEFWPAPDGQSKEQIVQQYPQKSMRDFEDASQW